MFFSSHVYMFYEEPVRLWTTQFWRTLRVGYFGEYWYRNQVIEQLLKPWEERFTLWIVKFYLCVFLIHKVNLVCLHSKNVWHRFRKLRTLSIITHLMEAVNYSINVAYHHLLFFEKWSHPFRYKYGYINRRSYCIYKVGIFIHLRI